MNATDLFYFYHYISNVKIRKNIKEILKVDERIFVKITGKFFNSDERSLPGCSEYLNNKYYKRMLNRYIISSYFTKNKKVLDYGCGLGWGAYLISFSAKNIIAIDNDMVSIEFNKKVWNSANLTYVCAMRLILRMINLISFYQWKLLNTSIIMKPAYI